MRTLSTSFASISLLLLGACAASTDDGSESNGSALSQSIGIAPSGPTLSDRAYYFEGLGSRCFDFGGQAYWTPGEPVMIYDCNHTVAQQVRVREIDTTHDVELRVQSLYCIGVRGGAVVVGQPLEIQTSTGSPAQRFALDGDSVLMGTQTSGKVTREVVIEPANDASPNRMPLVVGTRDVSDAEYFRVQTVDATNAPPTTGFVPVNSEASLRQALSYGWGSVVEVAEGAPLTLGTQVTIPAGVTLRGYRKHRNPGATVKLAASNIHAILVQTDDVRITGLRFVGGTANADAIEITTDQHQRVLVDHNDPELAGDALSQVTRSGELKPGSAKGLDSREPPR